MGEPDPRIERWVGAVVGLGIALRFSRYLIDFPLWGDEAFVAASLHDASYRGWLAPLRFHQVCPPLFIAGERLSIAWLGFSERALRLLPLCASVASVPLFALFARVLLRGAPLLLAVAIFAVSYYPIRHGAEVKPYALDLCWSLILLVPAARWLRKPDSALPLVGLALAVPFALWSSHPSVFVAGGVALALAWPAMRRASRTVRAAYVVYVVALAASFAAVYALFTAGQMNSEAYMFGIWEHTFPPLAQPLDLAVWLVDTHTSYLFAHPAGGRNGASALTAVCVAIAVVVMARRRAWTQLVLLCAPFALNLAAAALRLYPYGGSTRWMLHLAPAVAVLAGAGAALILARMGNAQGRALGVACTLLATFGIAMFARDCARPYKNEHDRRLRDLARAFWRDEARGAELACTHTDLGLTFSPASFETAGGAQYLSDQWIYSERSRRGEPIDWSRIAHDHPLRCAVYQRVSLGLDEERLDAWLAQMQQMYVLVDRRVADVVREHKSKDDEIDRITLFEFVPR